MSIFRVLLPILCFILTACPGKQLRTKSDIEKNNMDFPNPKQIYELGINFELSDLFIESSYMHYAFNETNSTTYTTDDNSIYFTIEKFTTNDLLHIQYINKDTTNSNLEALRDFYANKRFNSMGSGEVSKAKPIHGKHWKKGWLQSIIEKSESTYQNNIHYLTATIAYKHEFFVLQLICEDNMMSYFLDDFNTILQSIK